MPSISQLSNKPKRSLQSLALGFDPKEVVAQARGKGLVKAPTEQEGSVDELKQAIKTAREMGLIQTRDEAFPIRQKGTPATEENKIKTEWIDVTPEMAERWLEGNF